ncbi:hypothetical protein EJ419_03000 [Alloscardovia theropitheci]|uniref:YcaO domain-containing protein n=1 Tax=Alloscardovia theropitheci TaxID=2496842 RepID=A0A4R0QQI4_9BIFI|nr:YcaO-like family protein [Alloscardovia theropitheci]TCD54582.1 hypothetical protein EJ419_03000 [Alloscardovia theropitheci]
MTEFPSPERQFTLSQSLSAIVDLFSMRHWEWTLSTNSLSDTGALDSSVFLDRADSLQIDSDSSRGKGRGLESIASGLYELLEHITFDSESNYWENKSLERIRGDSVLDLAGIGSRDTDYTFENIMSGRFASLPSEYCGGRSTGEFEAHEESLIRCYYTNNGWASGASISEATLHALNELLERDATSQALLSNVMGTVRGKLLVPEDNILKNIQDAIKELTSSNVFILSVPSLSGFTVLSICLAEDTNGLPHIGCGSSQFKGYATYRSLLELWQELCADKDFTDYEERERTHRLKILIQNFPNLHGALLFNRYLQQDAQLDEEAVTYDLTNTMELPSVEEQITNIVSNLSKNNISVWRRVAFQAKNSDSSGFCNPSVVQIVAPGLERFHIIRHGYPVELIGRLRNHDSITAVRKRTQE